MLHCNANFFYSEDNDFSEFNHDLVTAVLVQCLPVNPSLCPDGDVKRVPWLLTNQPVVQYVKSILCHTSHSHMCS